MKKIEYGVLWRTLVSHIRRPALSKTFRDTITPVHRTPLSLGIPFGGSTLIRDR